MSIDWSIKMDVGDFVEFDEEFYTSMKSAKIDIRKVALVTEAKDMFFCVRSGTVEDLWVSLPDIKKIKLDKASK